MSELPNSDAVTAIIIQTVKDENPQSVKQLVDSVHAKSGLRKKEIITLILKLKADGAINLNEDLSAANNGARSYVWYLLTISVALIATVLAFIVTPQSYPLSYARNFFGLLLIFFVPGYAFAKAFFPKRIDKPLDSSLAVIELVVISVALSIAFVSIIGLILYYSPLKLDLSAILVSLFLFSFAFATAGLLREKQPGNANQPLPK